MDGIKTHCLCYCLGVMVKLFLRSTTLDFKFDEIDFFFFSFFFFFFLLIYIIQLFVFDSLLNVFTVLWWRTDLIMCRYV